MNFFDSILAFANSLIMLVMLIPIGISEPGLAWRLLPTTLAIVLESLMFMAVGFVSDLTFGIFKFVENMYEDQQLRIHELAKSVRNEMDRK